MEKLMDCKFEEEKINNAIKSTSFQTLQKLEEKAGITMRFPDNILLVAAKGDELLNWQEMSSFYKGCQQYIIDGSDHSMTDFPKHWKSIKGFIGA